MTASMNPVEAVARKLDRLQQRSDPVAFVIGVVKKYGDDRGSMLAALLTYYGFMSLFPFLLVATTVLGFIGNATIENGIIGQTLRQFPVYGDQIGRDAVHPLRGSPTALTIGLLGLLYGSMGVAQAGQHAMAEIWNVPGVLRPGFLVRLGRAAAFFVVLALGMAATTAAEVAIGKFVSGFLFVCLARVAQLFLNVGLYLAVFRVLTPKDVDTRGLLLGAALGGFGYTLLLIVGTSLVEHQLRHAQAVYGQFGFVLGLIGWIYLVVQVTLYAAEVNVVRVRRLWPRSIVQPPLTDADKRVLHDIAHEEERRPEQRVGVGFEPRATVDAYRDADHLYRAD
jgi:YihY family inner membrane protein